MNDSTATAGDRSDQLDDEEAVWIRTVVAAALQHAELPFDEAARILDVATTAPAPQPPDESPSTQVQRTEVELPVLAPYGRTVREEAPEDTLLETSAASVEGYRSSTGRVIAEWAGLVAVALLVALLLQQFVVQAFVIPTASMESTVNVGDRVLVNKQSDLFGGFDRGDTVVFEGIDGFLGGGTALLKRVVALPGETIELRADGRLWIWGPGETEADALLLLEPYLDEQNLLLPAPSPRDDPASTIWHENCVNDSSNPARCTLGEDSYFMMGDNRGQSFDSRGFGPVPEENIVGRAFFRIWPLSSISNL